MLKPIKIPMHSFIDVITNSSTEIYVETGSKADEQMLSIINSILEAGGIDKKAEDLFEVETGSDSEIRLIPKDKSQDTIEIGNRIYSLFNIDAEYDG